MTQVVLASTSPRRRALLQQLGLKFDVVSPDYVEVMNDVTPPEELAVELALGKAQSVANAHPGKAVVSADTFIVFEGRVIGKPHTPGVATEVLKQLQGKTNIAVTGWAVVCDGQVRTGAVSTTVYMTPMTDEQIANYVATGEPLDKAGAYAVTGKGAVFVDRIEGSIDATVGLPLGPVARALTEFGVDVLAAAD